MSQLHATTIIARNYLPFARVLATSFREHHPDGVFTALILDDVERSISDSTAGMDVVRPEDFIESRELSRMAMMYNVLEFSTAVKPFLLRHLLDRGWPHVLYLDPDIRIYRSIEELGELAERESLVLTPHTVEPMARDDLKPSEFDILASGVYNLGFVGVGPGSEPFLEYWSTRLRRDCISDPKQMLFTDQRWVDFAPGYFPHHILRDPSINVAYWNVDRRKLTAAGSEYFVDGLPLRFFHFSGFDPSAPYLLSKYQGSNPRVVLSEDPVLARLCAEYADALMGTGWAPEGYAAGYAYGSFGNGMNIDAHMRRVYREALIASESVGEEEPPNPFFEDGANAFIDWLREPLRPGLNPRISRYLEAVYQSRPDVRHAYPALTGGEGDRFIDWVISKGRSQEEIAFELVPEPRSIAQHRAPRPVSAGVNVAGFFQAELGVGEGARLLVDVLEAAGEEVATYKLTSGASRSAAPFVDRRPTNVPFDVNILCANADRTAGLRAEVDEEGFFSNGYTIATWAWETEDFPDKMYGAFDVVDEIWAVSTFAAEAIRQHTTKPVIAMPHAVAVPAVEPTEHLNRMGIGGRPTFLFLFDYLSVIERKNPIGLIEAFREAFKPDEGPALLIKTLNGGRVPLAQEALLSSTGDRPDIFIVDEYMDHYQRLELMSECIAYVSLHRGEGFGLTMAEAMSLGKPVIATGYSGNRDFMDPENSFLVAHELVQIPERCEPYRAGGLWAEPAIQEAARLMRLVVDRPDLAAERGRRAKADIQRLHSIEVRRVQVGQRLKEIRAHQQRSTSKDVSIEGDWDPLPAVSELVSRPPPVETASRYGRAGVWLRRAVIRLLRPYWFSRRSLDEALVEAVRDERRRRERTMGETTDRLNETAKRLSDISNAVEPMVSYMGSLAKEIRDTQRTLSRIEPRLAHGNDRTWASAPVPSDSTRPVGGGIDLPREGERVDRMGFFVGGWALITPHAVSRVEVTVEGLGLVHARLGLPRPDLDMLFPTPESAVCGFEALIDLDGLDESVDSLTVSVTAYSADGATFHLGSRRVQVGTEGSQTPQVISRIADRAHLPRSAISERRILVFSHDLERAGAQRSLLDLVTSLSRDWSLTLVSTADGPLRRPLESLGVDVELVEPAPLHDAERYVAWLETVTQRLLATGSYSAVLVNTMVPFWGAEIAESLGAPSIWSLHEYASPSSFWTSWMRDIPGGMDPSVLGRCKKAIASCSELVIPSERTVSLLERHRRSGDFRIVKEAVDVLSIARRRSQIDPAEARKAAGIPLDAQVLLCVGSIEPLKSQVVLVEALNIARQVHREAHLVLVGARGGDYERGLRRLVEQLHITEAVTIVPFADDVVPWYAMADVFVCPSASEMQPHSLLDAMACRLPVVASAVGGIPDVVVDGQTGFLCEPSNVMSLAVALDRALRADAQLRKEIAERGYQAVSQNHDVRDRRISFESLLNKAIDEPGRGLRVVDR